MLPGNKIVSYMLLRLWYDMERYAKIRYVLDQTANLL